MSKGTHKGVNNSANSKVKKLIFSAVIFVVAGLSYGAGYYYHYQETKKLISEILPVRENNFNYKFIYPLLRYDFGDAAYFTEDKNLKQKFDDYIQQQYQNKKADKISVYFTNLKNNQWSGVNEDSQFHPGSMMKVMIAMDYYRLAQLDLPYAVMDREFVYSGDVDKIMKALPYATPTNLNIGQSYTTKFLIKDMIENSDNGAETLLLNNDDPKIMNDIYVDLGIKTPVNNSDFTISAKEYSRFLKILYNATYLSDSFSDDILSIMSKTTFKDGISAGLPSDIIVAQKYGEGATFGPSNEVLTTELSNCGIIYDKSSPYELCVMTKANGPVNQEDLASIIKDISGIVYNYVNSN